MKNVSNTNSIDIRYIEWLTSSISWSEIRKRLQEWIEDEENEEDGENFMELTLDIINLILYV